MKKSHYTYCVKFKDNEYILLNASSGRLAVCNCDYATVYESGQGSKETLDSLYSAGFYIEDNADEITLQQEKFEAARCDNSQLFLSIAPTYACNCRCAYCYEQDKVVAKAPLNDNIEQAIYAFIEEQFETIEFSSLFVEWYGGDPQLCLEIVDRMSQYFILFCNHHGIEYDAMMLSNSTRIGDMEAQLIANCHISSMLVTIDGPEDLHNARRPAIDVDNPYQAIREAITYLQEVGVRVNAAMNADKVNMTRFTELHDALRAIDVEVTPVLLNDYAHTFNAPCEKNFCRPNFDLYTHEEFAHARYEQMRDEGFNPAVTQRLFTPFDHFCSGQKNATYVIDALGDVYKCDGWMGDKSRSLFNILDEQSRRNATLQNQITFNPFEDKNCRICKLLPLCMGNCSWERELTNWPCHPFAYTLERYLKSYRACFPQRESAFEILV